MLYFSIIVFLVMKLFTDGKWTIKKNYFKIKNTGRITYIYCNPLLLVKILFLLD